MFSWAAQTFDKLSQTVAPPPTDGAGRFAYCVQRGEEDSAMGCIAEIDPVHTMVNQAKGQYPIHLACQYSQVRLLQLLMNQPGINVNQPDSAGNTPLHYACMSQAHNSLEFVKLMITSYGASVLSKNSQGQTPYDVATMNSIRQHLLPIQLQAETQIALDNGGQGLPPGIDMGGLRINNPAMPPPPTFGGAPGTPGPVPTASASLGNGGNVTPAPGVPPAAGSMFGTPSPNHVNSRIASAPVSASINVPEPSEGYLRVGGSSLALAGVNKYRADGFSSSSSDVRLQKKYGHSSSAPPGGLRIPVAPPPSSGNSAGLAPSSAAPVSGGGPNPFAAGVGGGGGRLGGGGRYVAYGNVAAPAPTSGPAYSAYHTPAVGLKQQPQATMFTPKEAGFPSVHANAPAPAPTTYQTTRSEAFVPSTNAATPTTPYMPPPPYQSHNYDATTPNTAATSVGDPYQQPDFISPAAATYSGSPDATSASGVKTTLTTTGIHSANMAESNVAGDVFSSVPSPQKESSASASIYSSTPVEPAAHPSTVDAAGPTGLPENWLETVDPSSGQVYYYNNVTNETSWERPGGEMTGGTAATESLPENWVAATDPDSGHPYYYNTVTQETSWEKPLSPPLGPSSTESQPKEFFEQTQKILPSSVDAESSTVTSEQDPVPVGVTVGGTPQEMAASTSFGSEAAKIPFEDSATNASDAVSSAALTESNATGTSDVFAPPDAAIVGSRAGGAAVTSFEPPQSGPTVAIDAFVKPASVDDVTLTTSATDTFAAPAPILASSTSVRPTPAVQSSECPARNGSATFAPPASTAVDTFSTAPTPEATSPESVLKEVATTTSSLFDDSHLTSPQRKQSADQLFAGNALEVADPTAIVPTDLTRTTSEAEELFGASSQATNAATSLSEPPHVTLITQPKTVDETDGDGVMDDVPLSPSGVPPVAAGHTKTAIGSLSVAPSVPPPDLPMASAPVATPGAPDAADSLFAAIGMPPPPFSSKKR